MTTIYYPDFEARSSNGKFTLEVRSPHNGTINHRDGSPPSDDEFAFVYREHQSDFRYRLLANTSGSPLLLNRDQMELVWEGWQDENEDSPHDAVVSDDGWSIVQTHGFRHEIIVVSPSGKDVLHVQITGVGAEHHSSDASANVYSWSPKNLRTTTAGLFWTGDSRSYFFRHQG